MKKGLLFPILALALALSGCSAIGGALGMVPQADLDTANARVADLEGQLTQRDSDLAGMQAQFDNASARVTDLEGENENLAARNELLEPLVCADRTWDDFFTKSGFWGPERWFDEKYTDVFLTLQSDWGFTPEMTQWTPIYTEWNNALPGYLIVWDHDSAVWSMDEHCLILDPAVYRDIGK